MSSSVVSTNRINNPSFETGVAGWFGARCTFDTSTEWAEVGEHSLHITVTDNSAAAYVYNVGQTAQAPFSRVLCKGGDMIRFRATVRSSDLGDRGWRWAVSFYDESGANFPGGTGPLVWHIVPGGETMTAEVYSIAPEGAFGCLPLVYCYRGSGTLQPPDLGEHGFVDAAICTVNEEITDYFDGDSTRSLDTTYEWVGERHHSTSVKKTIARSPIVVYPAPEPRVARVIAERIRTGEILSWDVPLLDGTSTRELSGPGGINGWIGPVDSNLLGPDGLPLIREWSTALYHEVGGQIRAAGIVARFEEDDDGKFVLEAPGFSTYPHGIIHNKTYSPGLGCDALTAYRHFWDHAQSFPDSDLGVTVDTLLSGEVLDEEVESGGIGHTKGYRVPWWEFRDCGSEMDQLLEVASADYIERHGWSAGHTGFTHHIDLGVPRLGKKRSDLRFVEGENIIEAVPLTVDGDDFAQTVIGVGRGEGRKIIHTEVAHRDDRLRRTALVVDKTASSAKVKRLANREYQRRNDTKGFESVVIRDHPNARISDIDPGDDLLIEAELQWHGRTRLWNRVISIEQAISDDDIAVLRLARSDAFRY